MNAYTERLHAAASIAAGILRAEFANLTRPASAWERAVLEELSKVLAEGRKK